MQESEKKKNRMDITDIIGKGKVFEPPFSLKKTDENQLSVWSSNGYILTTLDDYCEDDRVIAKHIVELLNERWKNAIS